ncbi:Eco57I restriction-modification methylase domain-containing protein, partial [Listeria monocytogenes]|nr:Eco57I restriction-modification methylase domain-containing protein [Listeria monocytogenes]
MKFDVVIGNPPYQEKTIGNSTQAPPIYNKFMDLSYDIADKAVLITPARFLFNAGATGKAWNEKMLNDKHLKVIYYKQNSADIFPNTDIKGGVAVTYWDVTKNFGAIKVFTSFPELNSILQKVNNIGYTSLSSIIAGRSIYKLTDLAIEEVSDISLIQSSGNSSS